MQSGRKFLKIVFIIFSVLINLSIVTPGKSQENIELPDYVIQSGDNISTIALKFNTTPDEILAVNQLADANLLRIGDRIKIPKALPPRYLYQLKDCLYLNYLLETTLTLGNYFKATNLTNFGKFCLTTLYFYKLPQVHLNNTFYLVSFKSQLIPYL